MPLRRYSPFVMRELRHRKGNSLGQGTQLSGVRPYSPWSWAAFDPNRVPLAVCCLQQQTQASRRSTPQAGSFSFSSQASEIGGQVLTAEPQGMQGPRHWRLLFHPKGPSSGPQHQIPELILPALSSNGHFQHASLSPSLQRMSGVCCSWTLGQHSRSCVLVMLPGPHFADGEVKPSPCASAHPFLPCPTSRSLLQKEVSPRSAEHPVWG